VLFHDTGIAATLADCRYVNGNNVLENIDGQFLTDGIPSLDGNVTSTSTDSPSALATCWSD
jgi:hypothetical protein